MGGSDIGQLRRDKALLVKGWRGPTLVKKEAATPSEGLGGGGGNSLSTGRAFSTREAEAFGGGGGPTLVKKGAGSKP